MDIKNCRKCGRLFQTGIDAKYCPSCSKEVSQLLKAIKEYMHLHPDASVQEVSMLYEVTQEMIVGWIKDQTLFFEHVDLEYKKCERCGVAVDSGRYCNKCKMELASGITGALEESRAAKKRGVVKPKMRFLNKTRRK